MVWFIHWFRHFVKGTDLFYLVDVGCVQHRRGSAIAALEKPAQAGAR